MLRMEFAVHVARNANPPILFCFLIISANMRHCRDMGFVSKPIKHSAHGKQRINLTALYRQRRLSVKSENETS